MKFFPLRLLPLFAAWTAFGVHAATPSDAAIVFSDEQIKSLAITLVAPKPATIAAGSALTARVIAAPDAEWVVTAQTSGVVVRMPAAEGDSVEAGAVLAELRSAEAPQMGAELIQAESAARLASSELERDRQLHQEGIIAARRVQTSEQAATQAESHLAAVRMRFKLLGISATDASNGRVLVRAPSNATVLERLANPGQRVAEADPLVRLVDANKLILELQVPINEASFAVGDTLALPDGRRATVKQPGWGTSEMAQTVRVRAALPAGASGLRPGQWLKVQREAATSAAWVVPATAIGRQGTDAVVFVRAAPGFTAIPVKVLASDAGSATVSGALTANSAVASTGTIAVKGAWLGHGGSE
ncbi:efflux RND transporter periplasmic adaptor subunit [Nevskia ramosa]|uniref:efflux RND transporter periplasmic adaptor subunit n=1 Tax=Nevskia ramosa TaxID=64002 RepID=UPI003D0B8384